MSEQGKRAIADIESDLLKAEEVFVDADARLKKAERDRRMALDKINKHQMELDEAIEALRQRSIPGSKWRLESGEAEYLLVPEAEDKAEEEEVAPKRSNMASAAAEFARLRAVAQSVDEAPVPSQDDEQAFPAFKVVGPS